MNGLVFYIGLGLGLALAAGLRPFLPALLAGALASNGALGVAFTGGTFGFLRSGWWLLAVTVVYVAAWAVQVLFKLSPVVDPADRKSGNDPLAAALAGMGIAVGALLFAGTLAAHGDAAWPGAVGGVLAAGLAQRAVWPIVAGARARLTGGAREALTLYLDGAALLLAALLAALHPLGYVAAGLFVWLLFAGKKRAGRKYAGLRILGR
jgi:hypothetical protein